MRIVVFILFVLSGHSLASAEAGKSTREAAHEIASELISALQPLQEQVLEIYRAQSDPDLPLDASPPGKEQAALISARIHHAAEPFDKELKQGLAESGTASTAGNGTTEITRFKYCQQAALLLAGIADDLAKGRRLFLNPGKLPTAYGSYMLFRELCIYQLGQQPPDNLKQPVELYRAQVLLARKIVTELEGLSSSLLKEKTRVDYIQWGKLLLQVNWHLHVELMGEFYKLDAIASTPHPYSVEMIKTKQAYLACLTFRGELDFLVSKFIDKISRNSTRLLDPEEVRNLDERLSECEAVLDAQ